MTCSAATTDSWRYSTGYGFRPLSGLIGERKSIEDRMGLA